MWIADKWQDFELIDCSKGEKLERWGRYYLVRPDPQAIWDTPRRNSHWNDRDARYRRSETGGGSWDKGHLPENWKIRYGELTFNVKPMNFKHTGLFPEQAVNWDWCAARIAAARAAGREVSLLNLFGYTGAASVAAAAAGARVCHVDAAKGMVEWCGENVALSGLDRTAVRTIVDDCVKFVRREAKRGRRYDALILDPPSYGRGAAGELWKLESHLWPLLQECRAILGDDPLFVLVNAYTTGLSPTVVANLLAELLADRPGTISAGEVGLPVSADGKVLPCGIYGRWEA